MDHAHLVSIFHNRTIFMNQDHAGPIFMSISIIECPISSSKYANGKSVLQTILSSHLVTVAKSTHCLTRSCFPGVVLPLRFSQCLNSTTWTSLGIRLFTEASGMSSNSTSCCLAVHQRRNSSSFTSRKFGHGDISLTWTLREFSNCFSKQHSKCSPLSIPTIQCWYAIFYI